MDEESSSVAAAALAVPSSALRFFLAVSECVSQKKNESE